MNRPFSPSRDEHEARSVARRLREMGEGLHDDMSVATDGAEIIERLLDVCAARELTIKFLTRKKGVR